MVKILFCSCKHEAQDKLYGIGQRLMNPTAKTSPQQFRCTVCDKERSA